MPESKQEEKTILSFASCEKEASVCIAKGDRILSSLRFEDWLKQFSNEEQVGRSSALVSMIKNVMANASVEGPALDAIALTNGPGRFTGLRVAVVTARMLSYAWNVPVIAVNALEVAADKLRCKRLLNAGSTIWAITDAQRRQVFAAKFHVNDQDSLETDIEQALFERTDILNQLESGDFVTGSGAFAIQEQIEERIKNKLPTPSSSECDAIGVAHVSVQKVSSGQFVDPLKIAPIYFRPSAAEEVRLAKRSESASK